MKKRKRIITRADKRKIANRNRRSGRQNEKVMCEMLGMLRQGAYGDHDGEDDLFMAEFKYRKSFIGLGWMEQAIKNAKGKKIPIVGIHVAKKHRDKDMLLLQMRICDWLIIADCVRKEIKKNAALLEALKLPRPS